MKKTIISVIPSHKKNERIRMRYEVQEENNVSVEE